MGAGAMRREHLVRMLTELEDDMAEPSGVMRGRLRGELELSDNDWEAKRPLEADRLKFPLLANEEWGGRYRRDLK